MSAAALCGPAALAFFSGGYFSPARTWAGAAVWVLLAVGVLTSPPLRFGREAMAVAALALLAGWTLLSVAWAPVPDSAYAYGQIAVLYLGALAAAWLLLRRPAAAALAEPVLATGILAVVVYGLSERLLPGLLHFARSASAQGRLEQPLTYWNAMGELAALGFVLAVRLAGDERRARWLRGAAAAAGPALGLGLYTSFSRGALFAAAAGLLTLMVAAGRRAQLRAVAAAVIAAGVVVAVAAPLSALTAQGARLGARERAGAIELGVLAAVTLAAGLWGRRHPAARETARLPLPRGAGWLTALLVCVGLGGAIVVGAKEGAGHALSGGASRYVTLESNRYAYWRVALQDFGAQPLRGTGAGGWAVSWLQHRRIEEYAVDAHSLPLQTLAELGLVGALLLLALLGEVGAAARRAWRRSPAAAAGPVAACVTWLVHQPLDWDWEMPAVTLVGVVLGGLLLAQAEGGLISGLELRGAREPDEQHGAPDVSDFEHPHGALSQTRPA